MSLMMPMGRGRNVGDPESIIQYSIGSTRCAYADHKDNHGVRAAVDLTIGELFDGGYGDLSDTVVKPQPPAAACWVLPE